MIQATVCRLRYHGAPGQIIIKSKTVATLLYQPQTKFFGKRCRRDGVFCFLGRPRLFDTALRWKNEKSFYSCVFFSSFGHRIDPRGGWSRAWFLMRRASRHGRVLVYCTCVFEGRFLFFIEHVFKDRIQELHTSSSSIACIEFGYVGLYGLSIPIPTHPDPIPDPDTDPNPDPDPDPVSLSEGRIEHPPSPIPSCWLPLFICLAPVVTRRNMMYVCPDPRR